VLSYESELGKKLLGRKVGDPVRVGNDTLTVAAIEPAR
jgi:transcription elongation GreA/GreB family factor